MFLLRLRLRSRSLARSIRCLEPALCPFCPPPVGALPPLCVGLISLISVIPARLCRAPHGERRIGLFLSFMSVNSVDLP